MPASPGCIAGAGACRGSRPYPSGCRGGTAAPRESRAASHRAARDASAPDLQSPAGAVLPPPAPPDESAGTNDGNARTAASSRSPLPAAPHPADPQSLLTAPEARRPSTREPPAATPAASPSHTDSDPHTSPVSAPRAPRAAIPTRPAPPTQDSPPESAPPSLAAPRPSRCKPRRSPLSSATHPAPAPLYAYATADAPPGSPGSAHSRSRPETCSSPAAAGSA